MNKSSLFSAFLFALSMITLGATVVPSAQIINNFPIFFGIVSIFFFTILVLGTYCVFNPKVVTKIEKKDLKLLLIQSIVGVVVFRIFFFYSIKIVGPVDAGIVSSITPAVIALFGYFFFREKLVRKEILGVFLSILGILVLNIEYITQSDSASLLGMSLALIAVVLDSVFIVTGMRVSKKLDPMYKSFVVAFISFVCLLPLGLLQWGEARSMAWTFELWKPVLMYGLLLNPLIYVFLYLGGSNVSSGMAGILSSLIPISAVAFSFIVLGATITQAHVVGTILIVAAIVYISLAKKNPSLL